MIEGCLEWQHSGLAPPPVVRKATEDYLDAEDVQALWMTECCRVGPEHQDTSANLYALLEAVGRDRGRVFGIHEGVQPGPGKAGNGAQAEGGGLAGFAGIAVKPRNGGD